MAMLSLTFGPSPASNAWRALPADVADRSFADASRQHCFVARIAVRAAQVPAVIESAPEALVPFTQLEVSVICIGMSDPLSFLEPGARLTRLRRFLFGTRPPNPLANERLEALRLVVIAYRQRHRSPAGAIKAALAAGIPQSQLDALAVELNAAVGGQKEEPRPIT